MNNTEILEEIYSLLYDFFKEDLDKVDKWLNTINPLLGGVSPSMMLVFNREQKLLDFIKSAIEENTRLT